MSPGISRFHLTGEPRKNIPVLAELILSMRKMDQNAQIRSRRSTRSLGGGSQTGVRPWTERGCNGGRYVGGYENVSKSEVWIR